MRSITTLYISLIFLFTVACGSMKIKSSSEIEKGLKKVIKNGDTPGLQYVLVNEDSILINKSLGLANIDNNNKMLDTSSLMAYSMTKTFIAIVTVKLHEKGALSIESKVTKYLPKLPYGNKLKIKHLLNQTSGVPNPIPLRWAHLSNENKQINEKDVFWKRINENIELDFKPGEKYAYSNLSYAILGQILEVVTKKPLEQLFYETINKPLAISTSNMGFKHSKKQTSTAGYLKKWSFINFLKYFVVDKKMYSNYEDGWLRINKHYVDYKAMGGLITNAKSVALVLQDLIKEDSKLLNNESKKLLFQTTKNNKGKTIEMTLGWHIGEVGGNKFFFKEGGGAGFHCEMRIYPNKKIASVMMTNSTTFDVKRFMNEADLLETQKNNQQEVKK